MEPLLPSSSLVKDMELSELNYMHDRMTAIQNREGNPEGVDIRRFGHALCFYSRTMPWGSFNTVKGITKDDAEFIKPILDFYRERDRKAQFEVVPSVVDTNLLQSLSDQGFYQSGFHTSTMIEPQLFHDQLPDHIAIEELKEDQFETYAMIHCRGTGLPDSGIPPVAANNRVLYHRPG